MSIRSLALEGKETQQRVGQNTLINRSFVLIVILLATVLLNSCNSLFYFPTYDTYATPEALQIKYATVYVPVDEERTISAWHMSAGKDSKGVILQLHGNGENMTSHFLQVAWLVKFGYDVVVFDYEGYGSSNGIPGRAECVDDAKAMINWIRNHSKLKSLDLFVLGQSLGGAVAVPAVVESGQQGIRALIVDSTFASYRGTARNRLSSSWLTWPLQLPLSFLVSDELSPIDYVPRLKIPFLMLHGTRDKIIPIELGRKLFDAAPPEQREFWEVELTGHLSAFSVDVTPYKTRFVQYLAQHASAKGQ